MTGRTPYRAAFAAMTLALVVACSPAANAPATSAADATSATEKSLAEAKAADQAFSDYAQTAGMAEAFAKYMDSVDGKAIGPGQVIAGEAAIRDSFKNWPAELKMTWSPDMGHGSAGSDLAVTSGRWKREREGKIVAEGRYVTVWRKNGAGEWKGVIDVGVDDPAPAPPAATPDKPDFQGRPG
jgi:ketosteroid isomerase-like protein